MKKKQIKKWPMYTNEKIVGILPRRHFACAVQYPGDELYYIEPRKMPSKKVMREILKKMGNEDDDAR
jgi:hypothetical protein